MRLVILATAVSLFAAAASIACSAAQPPAADSSSDDTEAADSGTTTTPVATATATATAVVTGLDAGVVTPITTTDASVVIPIGTGTATPSLLCLPDSIQEFEPNNDVTTANVIQPVSSTYCGQVGPGDVDYVTVVMPTTFSGQLSFGFGIDGQDGPVNIQGFANGVPFSMGGGIPIGLGQPLTIQITSASGAAVDYRLRYTFQQF